MASVLLQEIVFEEVPGWALESGGSGLPAATIAMRVRLCSMTENPPRMHQFAGLVRSFPPSVTMDMLQRTIGSSLPPGSLDAAVGSDTITALEFSDMVHGRAGMGARPMLANGDAALARNFRATLGSLPAGERYDNALTFVRLSFLLGLTRAQGSDGYVNERVHSYGRFMQRSRADGQRRSPSQQACAEAFQLMAAAGAGSLTCGFTDAINAVYHASVAESNADGWCLRPDNLLLLNHLLVSDLMLSLNYFGSCIEGACNGIGATVLVRDGGGNYRESCKEGTGASEGATFQQMQKKANGTGADNTTNVLKMMTAPGIYDPLQPAGDDFIVELKRTSEMGLMQASARLLLLLWVSSDGVTD